MNYFLYNPVTQYDNMGDLLINKSLITLLRRHGQVIIDDNNKPISFITQLLAENDQKLSEITTQGLFNFAEHRLKTPSEDKYYLVFVPGDLSVKGFKKALSRVRFFNSRLRKLKQMGCRILRLGISLNTFDAPNMIAESLYSSAFHVYGLRDKQSIAKAERFRFSNVRYFPDLAWAFYPKFNENEGVVKGRYILISFRASKSGTSHHGDYFAEIKNHLFDVLHQSSLGDYKIVVSYQVQYDREAAQELVELFAKEFEVEFIDKLLSLDEAIHLYKGSDLIISNRLHVLLLGTICKTLSIPFINPVDNKKIAGIYKDNALYDVVLDYRNNTTTVSGRLVDMIKSRSVILNRLEERYKSNAGVIENLLEDIVNN
ncbi:polysaccharide pyruvyl transferase family protein [Olivibacter sp. CPCC 100613]|uniref:polysaccharide pyruvyl transferase family protein n=1 Tax=Olivibacter sp. CPCC 100613 TaxID=3079931 RepID=UPI002FF44D6F